MPKLKERQPTKLELFKKIIAIVVLLLFVLNCGFFLGFNDRVIYVCSIEKTVFSRTLQIRNKLTGMSS